MPAPKRTVSCVAVLSRRVVPEAENETVVTPTRSSATRTDATVAAAAAAIPTLRVDVSDRLHLIRIVTLYRRELQKK